MAKPTVPILERLVHGDVLTMSRSLWALCDASRSLSGGGGVSHRFLKAKGNVELGPGIAQRTAKPLFCLAEAAGHRVTAEAEGSCGRGGIAVCGEVGPQCLPENIAALAVVFQGVEVEAAKRGLKQVVLQGRSKESDIGVAYDARPATQGDPKGRASLAVGEAPAGWPRRNLTEREEGTGRAEQSDGAEDILGIERAAAAKPGPVQRAGRRGNEKLGVQRSGQRTQRLPRAATGSEDGQVREGKIVFERISLEQFPGEKPLDQLDADAIAAAADGVDLSV